MFLGFWARQNQEASGQWNQVIYSQSPSGLRLLYFREGNLRSLRKNMELCHRFPTDVQITEKAPFASLLNKGICPRFLHAPLPTWKLLVSGLGPLLSSLSVWCWRPLAASFSFCFDLFSQESAPLPPSWNLLPNKIHSLPSLTSLLLFQAPMATDDTLPTFLLQKVSKPQESWGSSMVNTRVIRKYPN